MKRFFLYMTAALCLFSCNDKNNMWLNSISDVDVRVTTLEELCTQMNTNIASLGVIVNALQDRDYVTNISEIKSGSDVIGYTISFAKNPTITIYKGNDGKDGVDGKDGKDGADGESPVVGFKQDNDGKYYWTLNGNWMLNDKGEKVPTTGQNGENGITPLLNVEEGYWYISYDEGSTWTFVAKAVGENGKDGKDGDSMFQAVTHDDNYAYFTLADGTIIKIEKNNSVGIGEIGFGPGLGKVTRVDGAIQAAFSVSATKKVYFSQGNLQYNAALGTHSCADSTTQQGTWRFAEHQYDICGEDNANISQTYDGWIDLFGWGTSGWNNGKTYYQPYCTSVNSYQYGPYSLTGSYVNSDWGVYNAISNGGNKPNKWRTLSIDEYEYLFQNRPNANNLHSPARLILSDGSFCKGEILFPDDIHLENIKFVVNADSYDINLVDKDTWKRLEEAGAVFLVKTGQRVNLTFDTTFSGYWTTTRVPGSDPNSAHTISLLERDGITFGNYSSSQYISHGCAVRLVQDVP